MANNCLWHSKKLGCRRGGLCPYHCTADAAIRCANYIQDDKTKTSAIDKLAAWADVSDKAHAIVAAGGVEIQEDNAQEVRAYVMSGDVAGSFPVSDGGPYEVILSKKSWGNKGNVGGWLQGWLCDCEWGYWHSGEPGDGGRFAGRFCFEPESLVLMADGSFKPICEIEVGEFVQSKTGARKVLNVFESDYDGEMVELSFTGSCFPVRMTADHNILMNEQFEEWVRLHPKSYISNPRLLGNKILRDINRWSGFKRACDFEAGDLVLFGAVSSVEETGSIDFVDEFGKNIYEEDGLVYWVWDKPEGWNGGRFKTFSPINKKIPFDDDFAYVLGWYLAEGSIEGHINKQTGERAKNYIRWTLNVGEMDVANRIISILDSWGCVGAKIYDYSYRGAIALKVSSRPLAELFARLCGEGSKGKVLERRIMLAPIEWQSNFLDAYWSGDGHVKGGCRSITTANDYLARQINQIIQRVYGVDAAIHINLNSLGPTYRGDGYGRDERENSGLNIYHIDYASDYVQRRYAIDGLHTAHRIKDIRSYHKSGKVWNIEVEDEHIYCVEGMLVHNCSHAYAALLVANMRARQDFMGDRAAMKTAYTTSKDYGWENYPYDDWKMRAYLNGNFAIIIYPHTMQNSSDQYLMRFQEVERGPMQEFYGDDLEALMVQADEMAWQYGGLEKKPALTDGY